LVDRDAVVRRLVLLDELLVDLDRARARGVAAYRDDRGLRRQTERALQLALQVCIDVAAHVVAEEGLGMPDDARGLFGRLARAGHVDAALADRLAVAAGLRNVLVHAYVDLDDERVFAALSDLDDLRAFARSAKRLADR